MDPGAAMAEPHSKYRGSKAVSISFAYSAYFVPRRATKIFLMWVLQSKVVFFFSRNVSIFGVEEITGAT